MENLKFSWWNRTGRMLLLNGDDGFFENYDGDFEQMLTEELPFSFHYLNYDSDSSILCFEQNVKVDFQILAKHIFEFQSARRERDNSTGNERTGKSHGKQVLPSRSVDFYAGYKLGKQREL